jgi:surface protein
MSTQTTLPTQTCDEPSRGNPQPPITTVLDLCLYRAVSDHCGGRILPYGIRQMIKDYAWAPFDNETLREAAKLWSTDRALAKRQYGEINDWDVSQVTSMSLLFRNSPFNDRIDRWDVGNVRAMDFMFFGAASFNQPLDTWDVRQVTNMYSMFCGASSFNQPLARWEVGSVSNMRRMFSRAVSFNQPLAMWDISQVTNTAGMFDGAESFNQPLVTWDVS